MNIAWMMSINPIVEVRLIKSRCERLVRRGKPISYVLSQRGPTHFWLGVKTGHDHDWSLRHGWPGLCGSADSAHSASPQHFQWYMKRVFKKVFKSKKEEHASLVTEDAPGVPGSSYEAATSAGDHMPSDPCYYYGCKRWSYSSPWRYCECSTSHRIHNYLTVVVDQTDHELQVSARTTTRSHPTQHLAL